MQEASGLSPTPNVARTISCKAWNSPAEYPSWVARCDIKGTMLNPIFWKKVQGHKHPGDGQMDSRLLNSLLNAEPRYIAQKLIPTVASELKKMMQLTRYTLRMQMTWLVLPQRRSNKNCGAGGWNGRMATKLPRIYRVPSIKPVPFFILVYSVYWTYLPACPIFQYNEASQILSATYHEHTATFWFRIVEHIPWEKIKTNQVMGIFSRKKEA